MKENKEEITIEDIKKAKQSLDKEEAKFMKKRLRDLKENKTIDKQIAYLEKRILSLQKELKSANSVRVKILKELGLGVRDRIVTATVNFIIKNAEVEILEPAVRKKDLLEFINKF